MEQMQIIARKMQILFSFLTWKLSLINKKEAKSWYLYYKNNWRTP